MVKEMRVILFAAAVMLPMISEPVFADVAVSLDSKYSFTGWPVAGSNHGWQFTVNEEIRLTHLGLFDRGDNGFLIEHPIGLWRLSDSELLASGTMSAGTGDPLLDDFRYIDVPDVDLSVGVDYVVGFYSSSDDSDRDITEASNLQVNPAINLLVGRWDVGGQFQMPANTIPPEQPGEPFHPDRFGPNFQFVPEPATISLLALGGLLLRRRK